MKNYIKSFLVIVFFIPITVLPQSKKIPAMVLDVGSIHMKMDTEMGDAQIGLGGGLQSQFSWNLAGTNNQHTELFYWPRDEWQSNMLYQIFNPVSLDVNGIIDANGNKQLMYASGFALTNFGRTVWAQETRRYRPPVVSVNGNVSTSSSDYKIDPDLASDIKIEFEDVLPQFGIRSHVEIYGFSNNYFSDFFIWKATHKFTGEITIPDDTANYSVRLPDQTIKFWWPIAFSFGPTKGGEKVVNNVFGYEGTDDLDNWFKRKSELVSGLRDTLYVAYYQDYSDGIKTYSYPNGSTDDTGDPDRITGHLYSTQIPGYALLYADKSNSEKIDDPHQPYSLSHAGIINDLWSRRDTGLKLTYRGDDSKGRFPVQSIPEKGPMRFITVGPYELTKDSKINRYDSITVVYAVGVGSIGWNAADSIGKQWFNGAISDSTKNAWVLKGKDSLWKALDMANWTWNRLAKKQSIPAPPPPPDVNITSGKTIIVSWSYPDSSYFLDAETGVDDWAAWRVYRKRGKQLVNDPSDEDVHSRWEMIFETNDRNTLSYKDSSYPWFEYYYAVTALDNGSQNFSGLLTGTRLESSRFVNMSAIPVNVTNVNDPDPKDKFGYSLQQNFPNPFNPLTKISYSIPEGKMVRLTVYDLLGKEITTLLNEYMNAGSYTVDFNAASLSSGMYIYSLETGDYRASRKLIVLK